METNDPNHVSNHDEKKKKLHRKEFEYLYQAVQISFKSNMRSKHGCIIVKNGKIISSGYNHYLGMNRSHQREEQGKGIGKYSIHAEEHALRNVDPNKLAGASLYVIRWGNNRKDPLIMDSKPCSKCQKRIMKCMDKYGLKNVYYSLDLNLQIKSMF